MIHEATVEICQSPVVNSTMNDVGVVKPLENTTISAVCAPLTDGLTHHSEDDHAESPLSSGHSPMDAGAQTETKEVFPETNTDNCIEHKPLGEELLQRLQEVLATAQDDQDLDVLWDLDEILRPWVGQQTGNSQTLKTSSMVLDSIRVIKEILTFFAEEKHFQTYDANLFLVFDRVSLFVKNVHEQHLTSGAVSTIVKYQDDIAALTRKINSFSYHAGILDGLYRQSIKSRITGVSSEDALLEDVTYDECPVCQDFEIRAGDNFVLVDNCQHLFCKSCIEQWMKEKKNCPMCRNDVGDWLTSDGFRTLKALQAAVQPTDGTVGCVL